MEESPVMEEFEQISVHNMQTAQIIINELDMVNICNEFDCKANLIGSVATGLLMNNLDIDYHIYPKHFDIKKIYSLIGKIAEKKGITETSCYNFLDTNDKSLDWHIKLKNKNNENWMIDMIFLRNDSPYVGKAEKIVENINRHMSESHKKSILRLKWESSNEQLKYKAIEIYKAVIEYGIETLKDFIEWQNMNVNIDLWEIKNPKG